MWTKTDDGSVVAADGTVIFFSTERFVRDICEGTCCFICGASPNSKPFNDEHVLPEWLLRRYDLFDRRITLPNGQELPYRSYTVPCCQECNTRLGREIEERISRASSDNLETFNAYAAGEGRLKVWAWLGLIFLKTHLKDRGRRVHADRRLGNGLITDDYDWTELHHIHSVVRSILNGYPIGDHSIGSMLIWPIVTGHSDENFDYMDLHIAQTIYLRLGSLGLFTVFNDSGAAMSLFRQRLARIDGPFSELQAKEVLVELAWLNLHVVDRPTHATYYIRAEERCWIETRLPPLRWEAWNFEARSALLAHAFGPVIKANAIVNLSPEELQTQVVEGRLSFLFNEEGRFIQSLPVD